MRFQDLVYAYDPVGNPVQITDQLATSTYAANQIVPNTRTFRYDPRYRLIRATGKRHKDATDSIDAPVTPTPSLNDYVPYTHRYSYDVVGNFTTNQEYKSGTNNLNYKSGAPDLFDGYGSESYSYDANGCCTSTPRHQTMGYSFDAQPVFVDMGGNTKVRYRRHGDQRVLRFVAKSGGLSALGVYLGPWEYHRREGGTAFVKAVLHVEAHSRCVQAERVLSGTDSSSLSVFHVHADHLGSAQTLTKGDATLLAQEEFFAYGRSSDRRDARARYRYIGVERDEDTGLSMTGPRTYDVVVGRFFQRDPIASSASNYAYAYNRPPLLADSDGYEPTIENAPISQPSIPLPEPDAKVFADQFGSDEITLPESFYPAIEATMSLPKNKKEEANAMVFTMKDQKEVSFVKARTQGKDRGATFSKEDISADTQALGGPQKAGRVFLYLHTHPEDGIPVASDIDTKAAITTALSADPNAPLPVPSAHLVIADIADTGASIPETLGSGVEARPSSMMVFTPSADAIRKTAVYAPGKTKTPEQTAQSLQNASLQATSQGNLISHYYTGYIYTKGNNVVGTTFTKVTP